MRKQAARKLDSKKLSVRLGKLVAKHGPGLAVKAGRVSKVASAHVADAGRSFLAGFRAGWDEI